jgi:hypothetical protein
MIEGKMNNWMIWFFAAMWILFPLIYSAKTIRSLILGWRIPTTWISALPSQGWVEVIGKVKGNPTKSLLKNSECAYWQFEVQEYQSGGKGGGRWKTVRKESSGPFEVDDMTGRVNIQAGDTDLVMNNESAIDVDQQTKASLQNLGVKTQGFLGFNKKLRVYERLIAPEEEILVLGKIQKSADSISLSGNSIAPLVISNLSKGEMLKTLSWRGLRPLILTYLAGLAFLIFLYFASR